MLVLVCISFILIISGCYVNTKEISENKSSEIIDMVKSGDTEGLATLFSSHARQKYDIEAQIEDALAFIDGEIVGTYSVHISGSESTTTSNLDDNITLYITADNIETTTGKFYCMHYAYAYTDFDDADNIGISKLSITNEDGGRDVGGE
jgi:hypothetical protein